MKIITANNNIILKNVNNFTLADTLDCGQAFRWKENPDGSWEGVAFGKYLKLSSTEDGVVLYDTTEEEFCSVWKDYFDFDRDYSEIITKISENEVLKTASVFGSGIRILHQDPWEALCSFIISQNNNIPRIKGIVERLCEGFGEPLKDGYYSFPTAEKIAALTLDDLAPLRSGFRAKYILDAAKKVASGEVKLEALREMEPDSARTELMKIYGVGEKVADCTLLFGLGHIEAFPKDVWIKKAMAKLFDGKLPEAALPYAGIAQQYIFHYARMTKLAV